MQTAGAGRGGLRVVLGGEPTAEEPRVRLARQLDHLDETAVHRDAAYTQPRLLQLLAELRVELVSVPVALAYLRAGAGYLARETPFREVALPSAEPHRAAHLFNSDEVAQLEDDGVRRLRP